MNPYVRSALVPFFSMALFIAAVAPAYAQDQEQEQQEVVEIVEPEPPAVATFTNITDAAPGVCFDATTTKRSETEPNLLVIGVHSGLNPLNWSNTACIASTAAFHAKQMSDTIAVRVEAPDGYYISRITVSANGSATSARLAQVFGGAQWVVDGHAAPATLDGAIAEMQGSCKTIVPVSFSIFLGAKIVGTPGTATASVSSPTLRVELAKKDQAGCP